jgi:hypothetical protein
MKTIADAPAQLNTNDKAMWVLGYNQAEEDRTADAAYVRECAITLSNFAIGKGMCAKLADIADRMEGHGA